MPRRAELRGSIMRPLLLGEVMPGTVPILQASCSQALGAARNGWMSGTSTSGSSARVAHAIEAAVHPAHSNMAALACVWAGTRAVVCVCVCVCVPRAWNMCVGSCACVHACVRV